MEQHGALARNSMAASSEYAASLINARLYLPEEWTDDPNRCLEAGVPQERMEHQSKEELALELVSDARRVKLRYGWIGADAGYGEGLDFPLKLDAMEEVFLIDIHRDRPSIPKP